MTKEKDQVTGEAQTKETKTGKSFTQRVLDRLNMGDEAKVKQFAKVAEKEWKKQIKLYKDRLRKMEEEHHETMDHLYEELEEFKEERTAAFEKIDPEKINGVNERKDYIHEYNYNVDRAIQKVRDQEELIDQTKGSFEDNKQKIQKAIEHFEFKLSMIQ